MNWEDMILELSCRLNLEYNWDIPRMNELHLRTIEFYTEDTLEPIHTETIDITTFDPDTATILYNKLREKLR